MGGWGTHHSNARTLGIERAVPPAALDRKRLNGAERSALVRHLQYEFYVAFQRSFWVRLPVSAAGPCHEMQWNQGVFGPGEAFENLDSSFALERSQDMLDIVANLIVDGEWRKRGGLPFEEQHARLLRNGKLLEEVAANEVHASVSPEPAHYRVEVEASRQSIAELSTHISLAWEFS